ncbi:MAG: hypothetical protein HY537_07455, partial [Deltaproteobacteria bacterium]|nr:hypothetical protein [Deltaproteobacteria bacterium]
MSWGLVVAVFLIFARFLVAVPPCASSLTDPALRLRVSAIQYAMSRPSSLQDWENKIRRYLDQSVRQSSSVVVFPELISIEGLALIDPQGLSPAQAIRQLARDY